MKFQAIYLLALAVCAGPAIAVEPSTREAEFPQFNNGDLNPKDKGIQWVQAITEVTPKTLSDVKGDVAISFKAPGMTNAKASCWQQPTKAAPSPWGHDVDVAADIKLDAEGNGKFTLPAEQFPNGPMMVRIYAKDAAAKQDIYQLQLFNTGGVKWNQGIPKKDPPAAAGMKLAFADDFDGPLSISKTGKDAKYMSHKTGGGDFSGYIFCDMQGPNNPFEQVGTYMRIRASKKSGPKGSTGIISSSREDGTGVFATAPCYFECRITAQSAPGTWPAFWLLSKKAALPTDLPGTDELDILEAYGGVGPKNPNFPEYAVTSHFWQQKTPDGKKMGGFNKNVPMLTLGGKSTWSTTFHTYAVKITEAETTYYFDDFEVLKHPTSPISKTRPFYFLINYAIGGISGWHTDLARYGDASDMYVDYVRVYQGEKTAP